VIEIQNDYQQLGIELLEDFNGQKVAGIAAAQHGNPIDNIVVILQQWLWGRGRMPVTWQTLVKCFQDAYLNVATSYIEGALSQ